jgi:hypothetical protein
MNEQPRVAVATVVTGEAAEKLDYTFTSFARCCRLPLYAFVLGTKLPEQRLPEIEYQLVAPTGQFSHLLREVYFRRLELIDELPVDLVLVVDAYDVLCLQTLPPFSELLSGAALAGGPEHPASRYILGQGYTSSFLNGGVMFWDVRASKQIREEIVARGRSRFRSVVDDQHCLNEVVFTRYYDRVRILPCQFNYRCFLAPKGMRGWPTVEHLDGVMIYHNGTCIQMAKELTSIKAKASLAPLPQDERPLNSTEQLWRRLRTRFSRHIVR